MILVGSAGCSNRYATDVLARQCRLPYILKVEQDASMDYQYTCIILPVKPLRFVGSSLDDLRGFPAEARRQAGFELYAIQRGLEPSDWRPMKEIGSGVREIRIHVLGEWRVIYVARFADAIYVLHAFQKKTQKTRRKDIETAQRRYKQIGK